MTIKEAREKVGLTQKEVARCLHIPTITIQKWEAGDRNPKQGESYWVEAITAIGVLTKEGRDSLAAGEISILEVLSVGKFEATRKLSKWGEFGNTFSILWAQIPDRAVDQLDTETLAQIADALKAAYDAGCAHGQSHQE